MSINVSDIERSLSFYQETLGLRLLFRQVGRGFALYFLADTTEALPAPSIDAVENRRSNSEPLMDRA
ncbi:MAG: VOC family protein [Verrucomicrobiales bacterium]